jgi:hypothetical protein
MRPTGMALFAALVLALPAGAKTAAKAEVTCNDGTTSQAGRGACSHHGGVAGKALPDAKAKKATKDKAEAKSDDPAKKSDDGGGLLDKIFGRKSKADTAQGRSATTTPRSSTRDAKSGKPTAKCKDGTTSYSAHHSGTCSGHGGVAEWLDK